MIHHTIPNKQHRCWEHETKTLHELVEQYPKCLIELSFKHHWHMLDMIGESGIYLKPNRSRECEAIYLTKFGWQYAGKIKLSDEFMKQRFGKQTLDTEAAMNELFKKYASVN